VPGPQQPLYLVGAKIIEQMFWVPQTGSIGMGFSILSYNGAVHFGLIVDKKNVPVPDNITRQFKPELEKLLLLTLMGISTVEQAEALKMPKKPSVAIKTIEQQAQRTAAQLLESIQKSSVNTKVKLVKPLANGKPADQKTKASAPAKLPAKNPPIKANPAKKIPAKTTPKLRAPAVKASAVKVPASKVPTSKAGAVNALGIKARDKKPISKKAVKVVLKSISKPMPAKRAVKLAPTSATRASARAKAMLAASD